MHSTIDCYPLLWNYAKLYFDAKQLEKRLNRGGEILGALFSSTENLHNSFLLFLNLYMHAKLIHQFLLERYQIKNFHINFHLPSVNSACKKSRWLTQLLVRYCWFKNFETWDTEIDSTYFSKSSSTKTLDQIVPTCVNAHFVIVCHRYKK